MTLNLTLSRPDPLIHIKAYGGLEIVGGEQDVVCCVIDVPELATLKEEGGQIYVTANAPCRLLTPRGAMLVIEKGAGSVSIRNNENAITIEKVLGNLVLSEIASARIEKVGGNFSVRNATGAVAVEKVGGNLVVDSVQSFEGEKIGGNGMARDVRGDFSVEKLGGGMLAQDVSGACRVARVGGSFTGQHIALDSSLRAGGDISLKSVSIRSDSLELRAGGDVTVAFDGEFEGADFNLKSGEENINIDLNDESLDLQVTQFHFKTGDPHRKISVSSGGRIALEIAREPLEDLIGDISSHFEHQESAYSELIQERVATAMRQADARVKAAGQRLDQLRDKLDHLRDLDAGGEGGLAGEGGTSASPMQPSAPVTRPSGKKGASDEERLMILQMLQNKTITVDEAETLFRALEE